MGQATHAQTIQVLESAARTIKRHIRESREILGAIKRAEVSLLGVSVETVTDTQTEEGHSDSSESDG